MKTILPVKLKPSDEQAQLLLDTMERFNAACDYISTIAFEEKCFSKFTLHKLVYYDVKKRFSLSAQVVIRAISKTIDTYKLDKKVQHTFRKYGAIIYDQRICSFKSDNRVSLWVLTGREIMPIVFGEHQKKRWHQIKGQAQLVYKDNKFYLLISVETEEMLPIDPEGYLGVDLGIEKIAVCSNGMEFSGKTIDTCREKYQKVRTALQTKGTKSAKRKLKKIRNKETNFRKHINHVVSKKIVEAATRSCSAIVLEDLKGICKQMKARKPQRQRMHGWSFFQLRSFISYKAALAGIRVEIVNPRFTSQRCNACGYTSKKNRKKQSEFVCVSCGFIDNADHNASKNIALLGYVNKPPFKSRNRDSKDFLFSNCAIA